MTELGDVAMKPGVCRLLLVLLATCSMLCCRAQLTITILRGRIGEDNELSFLNVLENSTVLQTYKFPSGVQYPLNWFVEPYASVPAGGITGLLYQPRPRNACAAVSLESQPQQALFNATLPGNVSAIAVVEDYHLCIERKIRNLKAAGFDAVITYNIDDTSGFNQNVNRKVYDRSQGAPFDVIETGFPIAVVSASFARYLIENAAIPNSGSNATVVLVHIDADSTSQGWIQIGIGAFLVVVFIGIPLLLFVCLLCCCCYCCLGTKCEGCRKACAGCHCSCKCRNKR